MTILDHCSSAEIESLFRYLGWNSFLSEKHKLFYVATPKVACTSLKWWFAELEGHAQALCDIRDSAETVPELVIHDSFHRVAPNVAGLYQKDLLEPLASDDYFRFALVRNPYKRIFSAWQSKLLLREPIQISPYVDCDFFNYPLGDSRDITAAFEGFLEHIAAYEAPDYRDVHWTPQVTLLRPDLVCYTKLAKIENPQELIDALSEWLGKDFSDPFVSRHTNESLIPYLPEFISPRSESLIREMYEADFESFDYDLRPPIVNHVFSEGEVAVAIKAVEMIRGRHQRFGEIRACLDEKKRLVEMRDQSIVALQARLDEQSFGNKWLEEQRVAWEKAAAERDHTIIALQALVEEQRTDLAGLEAQRAAWEANAAEHEKRIAALQMQLGDLLEGIVRLESERAGLLQRMDASDEVMNRIRAHKGFRLINTISRTKLF